ncbi:MAG TPA: hypothetical protein VEV16_06285 [Daejeonella sp.]|nr:hypothetical protein [Daejeonella sp.]
MAEFGMNVLNDQDENLRGENNPYRQSEDPVRKEYVEDRSEFLEDEAYGINESLAASDAKNQNMPGPGDDDDEDDDDLIPIEGDEEEDEFPDIDDHGNKPDHIHHFDPGSVSHMGTDFVPKHKGRSSGRMIDHEPGLSKL